MKIKDTLAGIVLIYLSALFLIAVFYLKTSTDCAGYNAISLCTRGLVQAIHNIAEIAIIMSVIWAVASAFIPYPVTDERAGELK